MTTNDLIEVLRAMDPTGKTSVKMLGPNWPGLNELRIDKVGGVESIEPETIVLSAAPS